MGNERWKFTSRRHNITMLQNYTVETYGQLAPPRLQTTISDYVVLLKVMAK